MNENSFRTRTNELPVSERPYEILEERGASSLTDAQLLAIIIRNGTKKESSVEIATRVLTELDGFGCDPLIALGRLSLASLRQFPGIGRVKALEIHAVMEIAHRISHRSIATGREKMTSETLAEIYMERMRFGRHECAYVAYLSTRSEFIGEQFLGEGTLSSVQIDIRRIFLKGFELGAAQFVLLHNHPSGDPTPGHQDRELTRSLAACGELLQMPMADHIVIGDRVYHSFKEHDEMPIRRASEKTI